VASQRTFPSAAKASQDGTTAITKEERIKLRQAWIDKIQNLFMPEVPKLPPLRQVNHKIPLKNPNLKITHRPAKCPELLRDKFREKFDCYVKARVLRSSCCDLKLTGNWTGLQLIRLDCSRSQSSLRKLSVASRSFSEKIEQLERLVQPVERLTFGCSNWSTAAQLQLDLKL
jgi:hypothetical protein